MSSVYYYLFCASKIGFNLDFNLAKKSNEYLQNFSRIRITRLALIYNISNTVIHYFYNSKTSCNRQKQTAFLKSALKSRLIKKEK